MSPAAATLVESLGQTIESVLAPFLSGARRVALVDFPDHPNVGDSAIWLGELKFLEAHSLAPVYLCRAETYSRERLSRVIGNGTILIHGGGNFGDLWQRHHQLREQIIRDFPANPIIQLPQTIHFAGRDALSRTRAIVNAHADLKLLVRDRRSLEFARNEFRAPAFVCPDMAFCLGALDRPVTSRYDLLVLARTDQEKRFALGGGDDGDVRRADWLDEPTGFLMTLNDRMNGLLVNYPNRLGFLDRLFRRRYWSLPRQRVRRGVALLSSGRIVVTDRLHAHILCLLLGIAHCILDNNYGKNRDFFETWTHGSRLAVWCESEAEAMSAAHRLLQAAGPQSDSHVSPRSP